MKPQRFIPPFKFIPLGYNSAMPSYGRFPSMHILNYNNKVYLLDCGEGTQIKLQHHKIPKNKINHIFITHLHGDHVFGLVPFLCSLSMEQRTEPMTIYAPKGIKEFVTSNLNLTNSHLNFTLNFVITNTTQHDLILEEEDLEVYTIPMDHGIPCNGYLFKEKNKSFNILKSAIETYKLTIDEIKAIKQGEDLQRPNLTVLNQDLILPPVALRSFAYCTDTAYFEAIVPYIKHVNLLYHEATWLHDTKENKPQFKHSSALEASKIAQLAEVKKLVLGHFSSRYIDLSLLLNEAKLNFIETVLCKEGEAIEIE